MEGDEMGGMDGGREQAMDGWTDGWRDGLHARMHVCLCVCRDRQTLSTSWTHSWLDFKQTPRRNKQPHNTTTQPTNKAGHSPVSSPLLRQPSGGGRIPVLVILGVGFPC